MEMKYVITQIWRSLLETLEFGQSEPVFERDKNNHSRVLADGNYLYSDVQKAKMLW